ncbi:2-5A-dependent ribonuclease [Colletotrichum fructicola]|uniref:Uncharacterized protein n=2 Tax=Colletotrichum fructicola (strain Nara gc5) TaxID=1213859 RepID=L2GHU4_COLFN|nr:2-5A-dependent ribonuclease [Colletotrichum fructicola]KAF4941275.1 2-5A-dependent ribonuclease [Colletotrichum fructicola]
MGADPNWAKNGVSALQIALERRGRVADTVKLAMALLDAGSVLNGGEIPKAIMLDDWALTDRLIKMDHWSVSQRHESMLMLEAAVIKGNQQMIARILEQLPDAYDPGALCASILFKDCSLGLVKYLLDNRPQLEDVNPLESLANGIAAWRENADYLDLVLAKLHKPSPVMLPKFMVESSLTMGNDRVSIFLDCFFNGKFNTYISEGSLFWRETAVICGSPLVMALGSETSLSRLLDHGFLPDRLTMSVAVEIGSERLIRKLARYPMLSSGSGDYIYEGTLTMAVAKDYIDIVKLLLDGNHCVDEDNYAVEFGRTPLQKAVEYSRPDTVKLLLNAGADVNAPAARSGGATALQLATIRGYLGLAKMLIDLGADINAPGARKHGRTALEAAAEHGRIDTIQYLLSQGVHTNGKGQVSYLRAIRYAELRGHLVSARLLKKWRAWTAEDNALWNRLKSMSKEECEDFIEDQLRTESEQENDLPGGICAGGCSQNVDLGGTLVGEVLEDEILDTTNPVGGFISEFEDLELLTSDTFTFWNMTWFDHDGD